MRGIKLENVTILGEITLFGRVVKIIQLASGRVTLACEKNLKQ